MFSPDAPAHTHSLRPKRNRTSTADDSIKPPQAKRKRSALRRDTFEPLQEASINEVSGREKKGTKPNGHLTDDKPTEISTDASAKELTIRASKKADKRSERASGALTLSSNDFYTISQLPALPEQIRSQPTVPYSCLLSPEYGYALALTHTDAIIWPYNSSATTPSTREVTTFKLPFTSATMSDPLPLAAFTARSASGEPGIVAVSPRSGKIVYWETITNASSFVPGQTSSGVQGSVPGMLNGETIKELVNAEPVGFVLTFSHGRVAHLTVRDQIGRPTVGVQFLRKSGATANAGLFGSIRSVFGGDRRKGTPLVRAGKSTKGQRDVVVVTEDAELEIWNTNLGIGNSLITATTFKEEVTTALQSLSPDHNISQPMAFKILDIDLVTGSSTSRDVVKHGQSSSLPITVLLSVTIDQVIQYYIIELVVSTSGSQVKVVHPIRCYVGSATDAVSFQPRLCILKSQSLALLVFESAIVLFSLAKIKESPSSQLLTEKRALPDPFQDCIRFHEDAIYRVLGYTIEEHEQQSACVLAVQAFGVVRLSSHFKHAHELDPDDFEERISAKSKIEQAVFFGTIKQNPLDLNSVSRQSFSSEELEAAALAISSEILSSKSKYIPKTAPSIDMQMKLRAKALDDLMNYLLKQYSSQISRNLRFRLLWNAEKLAAAQAIWKVQEAIQKRYPLKDREMSYLEFTLRALHESRQKYPDHEKGEQDRVRHWLINSVSKVEHLLVELVSCIPELEPMDVTDPNVVGEYLREAVDLWNAGYDTALRFREDNAPTYGLGDEIFKDGVLVAGYPVTIPHPWTSNPEPFRFGQQLIYDIANYLTGWWEFVFNSGERKTKMPTDMDGNPYQAPPKALLSELAGRLPVEVELFSRICIEENIQAECEIKVIEKDVQEQHKRVTAIKAEKRPRIKTAIKAICNFNYPGAIALAEKFKDPDLLVDLNLDYISYLARDLVSHPENEVWDSKEIDRVQDHVETYFETFGKGWAYAHFSRMIEDRSQGSLLQGVQSDEARKQKYLTWFFKKSQMVGQRVGKLSWINDVIGENKFDHAEQTLDDVLDEEQDLWKKKIELSLGKLAGLAAVEDSQETIQHSKQEDQRYENQLTIIEIQEKAYEHVLGALGDPIDAAAAEQLALEEFAARVVSKAPASKRLLKQALRALLQQHPLSPEEFVDLLTLSDPHEWTGDPEDDPQIVGREFSLALQIVDLSRLSANHKNNLKAVIWRRAMIRDDWSTLNNTTGKSDQQVETEMQMSTLFLTLAQIIAYASENGLDFELVSPREILDAETFPSDLRERFDKSDVIDGVRKDMEKEQAKLKSFVDKAQLELHYGGLVSSAERLVRAEMDRQGEETARRTLQKDAVTTNGV